MILLVSVNWIYFYHDYFFSSDLSICDVMSDFECCKKLYEETSTTNSSMWDSKFKYQNKNSIFSSIKSQSFLSALNETDGEKGFDEVNLHIDTTSDKQVVAYFLIL